MKDKDEYIKFLENKVSKYERNNYLSDKLEINKLIKIQEELLNKKINDKDSLLIENKRLNDENARLIQTIVANNAYIDYLLNTFWWKLSSPFRFLWRKIRNISCHKINYLIDNKNIKNNIEDKVSVIIFSYNKQYKISKIYK